jgi:transposase
MRSIGMDVHRSFAQIAVVEKGLCRDEGRIGVRPEDLRAWAIGLARDDEIALEATTNSDAIATMLRPLVRRVVVSNPRKTRAIAEAKVKTDKVDARILAQLLAADFLPDTWVPDDRTRMLRRLVMRRTHLVKQRTRLKNQVHGICSPVSADAGSPIRTCRRMSGGPWGRCCASWTSTATSSPRLNETSPSKRSTTRSWLG